MKWKRRFHFMRTRSRARTPVFVSALGRTGARTRVSWRLFNLLKIFSWLAP